MACFSCSEHGWPRHFSLCFVFVCVFCVCFWVCIACALCTLRVACTMSTYCKRLAQANLNRRHPFDRLRIGDYVRADFPENLDYHKFVGVLATAINCFIHHTGRTKSKVVKHYTHIRWKVFCILFLFIRVALPS